MEMIENTAENNQIVAEDHDEGNIAKTGHINLNIKNRFLQCAYGLDSR